MASSSLSASEVTTAGSVSTVTKKVVEKAAMGYLYTKNLLTAYNKSMKNLNVADFNCLNWSSWEWDKE